VRKGEKNIQTDKEIREKYAGCKEKVSIFAAMFNE
jgi:hypothetical protein